VLLYTDVFLQVSMSAEAADREAVTGSRPCTPPQTSWFEFLLDPSLLEQHLQGPHPGILCTKKWIMEQLACK